LKKVENLKHKTNSLADLIIKEVRLSKDKKEKGIERVCGKGTRFPFRKLS